MPSGQRVSVRRRRGAAGERVEDLLGEDRAGLRGVRAVGDGPDPGGDRRLAAARHRRPALVAAARSALADGGVDDAEDAVGLGGRVRRVVVLQACRQRACSAGAKFEAEPQKSVPDGVMTGVGLLGPMSMRPGEMA